jgi:hypothetical protein
MPASSSSDFRRSEEAIRAAVRRLSRPDGQGGAVIERAAIVAEGTPSAAIEAWVIDNGGQPVALKLARPPAGLHSLVRGAPASGVQAPRRYVLPAAALDVVS